MPAQRYIIGGGLLLASVLSPALATDSFGRIIVGQPFPEFPLPTLTDGSPMSVSDFRGRRLALHVFASW